MDFVPATDGLGDATTKVNLMVKGAAFHYTKPRISDQGELLPCAFPAGDTAWTPTTAPCDTPTGIVVSPPSDWDTPEWKALTFESAGDNVVQVRFETSPDGKTITMLARVDVDCTGEWSGVKAVLQGVGEYPPDCDLLWLPDPFTPGDAQ